MNKFKLSSLLESFFIEDIGEQDITTDLIFTDGTNGKIVFIAKEAGIDAAPGGGAVKQQRNWRLVLSNFPAIKRLTATDLNV